MSDQKENRTGLGQKQELESGNGQQSQDTALSENNSKGLIATDGRDVSGWDAYRRWLTRVQAPEKRRAPLDPALYTWKGYRSWSERVRRDWKPDEQ